MQIVLHQKALEASLIDVTLADTVPVLVPSTHMCVA